MAKKERQFHGEADFLRYQLRTLAEEMGTKIKDTNLMTKEECKKEIESLNRVKYKKELETERKEIIENFENAMIDRNNQIATLEKKELILKEEKQNCLDIILEKDEKIEELKIEIKDLQESNQFMEGTIQAENKTIAANIEKIEKLEKEIKEKNAEIRASQITLGKREKEIEEYKNRNMQLVEKIDILLAVIKELKNRKWYDPFLFWKKK